MKEYIEREAVLQFPIRKDHCDKEHANKHFIFGVESVMEYVENLPAADVAEVVRCSNCERRYEEDGEYICGRTEMPCADDDFCSFGARMDKEDENA